MKIIGTGLIGVALLAAALGGAAHAAGTGSISEALALCGGMPAPMTTRPVVATPVSARNGATCGAP